MVSQQFGVTRINLNKRDRLILLGLWAVLQAALFARNGIVTNGEAAKYIREAQFFLQNKKMSTANYWLYSTQIVLLATSFKLKLGIGFVVLVQLGANLASIFTFYKTAHYFFPEPGMALAGGIFFLLNVPYQEFNTYLQTESLFYSITLMYSCYLLRLKRFNSGTIALIVCTLALICITRPVGLLFVPPTIAYLYLLLFRKMAMLIQLGILFALGCLFLFLLNAALGSGGELDFMLPFREEIVICGVPTIQALDSTNTAGNGNSIFGLAAYIVHHFGQTIRLAWLRSIAFFGLRRQYYAPAHNFYLLIYFSLVHFMALWSLPYWIRIEFRKFCYLLATVLITWLTVMLACDDWHNRFYLCISPYLILLGIRFIKKVGLLQKSRIESIG